MIVRIRCIGIGRAVGLKWEICGSKNGGYLSFLAATGLSQEFLDFIGEGLLLQVVVLLLETPRHRRMFRRCPPPNRRVVLINRLQMGTIWLKKYRICGMNSGQVVNLSPLGMLSDCGRRPGFPRFLSLTSFGLISLMFSCSSKVLPPFLKFIPIKSGLRLKLEQNYENKDKGRVFF